MESCWLIGFKDGTKIIISEQLYAEEVARNWEGRMRDYEAHWFSFQRCREQNRGVQCYGFSESEAK